LQKYLQTLIINSTTNWKKLNKMSSFIFLRLRPASPQKIVCPKNLRLAPCFKKSKNRFRPPNTMGCASRSP
jgi:hypothetical protein